ncbi:uncharacterized protein BYT42DRAFT_552768 [Radiomyces spectabilis]|uniref:uncharacterized protein n=1 Tax=Radiomyces spectabilis TaxID=64574 RepID=UPI002220FD72|nr:uncharacterized protein BYT42DRAFT_552768 [Radiomyces spectabilis]KAI8393937.1 hypothetical protein BYT42DRAFT_552768 [Radiomyces spectabilis]
MAMLEIVYAVHNFEAENEDEIAFGIGEPIVVLEKDEKYQDGWWQGRNTNGEIGLFPMNYTSPIKPTHTSPTIHRTSYHSQKSNSSTSSSRVYDRALEDRINTMSILQDPPSMPNQVLSRPPSESDRSMTPPKSTSSPPFQPSIQPQAWNVEQVANWLESVGLGLVANNFIDQEITGDILLDLTIDTLKELGITTYGRRYKVMNAINKLKADTASSYIQPNDVTDAPRPPTSPPLSKESPSPRVSMSTGHLPVISQSALRGISTLDDFANYLPETPHSTPRSPIDSDSLYQFPRKAPLPPQVGPATLDEPHRHPPFPPFLRATSPISSHSFGSSSISRSNTFNTESSKQSSASSGTVRSLENHSPHKPSILSPLRKPSQKSNHSIVSPHPSVSTPVKMIGQPDPPLNELPLTDKFDLPHKQPHDHTLSVASFDSTAQRHNSTADVFQAPEHEGWLHKKSDKYKTWNKRWFVLKGTNLFYFKSPKDTRMKGIINLRGYRIFVDETIHAGKYSFKAQHEKERTFFFYSDTLETMRMWLQMLMKATIMRDFASPVMSSNQVATVSLDMARRMRPRPPSVIMYNKPHANENPKMAMVREEEETRGDQPAPRSNPTYKQTRESGITEYPAELTNANHDDASPLDPTAHMPDSPSAIDYITKGFPDNDEDLIDPHHKQPPSSSLPALSDRSSRSTFSTESGKTRPWTNAQYIDWINSHLPPGKQVVDLSSAFRNGDTLILLLESLSHKTVRRPPTQKGGSVSMMMLDNIVTAFKFMGREGVVVDGRYTIKDVFSGNEEKILDMVDAIKTWADGLSFEKKQDSVPIDKNSGWRGSAMLDQRISQEHGSNGNSMLNSVSSNGSSLYN